MDPVTIIGVILCSGKVSKAIHDLFGEGIKSGTKEAESSAIKGLIRRLQPTARERSAKHALQLFAEAWYRELEDTTPLTSSLPGYHDQLARLLVSAAPEIADWMDPDIQVVDSGAN